MKTLLALEFSDVVPITKFGLAPGDWYLSETGQLGLATTPPNYLADRADLRSFVVFSDDSDLSALRIIFTF